MSKVRRLVLSALVASATVAAPALAGSVHFALDRSVPAAESVVESPGEVRLWFTEEPQDGTVSIRLLEAEDAGVHVMDAAQDPQDPTAFQIELHGTLPAGSYTVSWRGMGADGHVVRDTFTFQVGGG